MSRCYCCRRGRPLTAPGRTWFKLFDIAAAIALAIMGAMERRRAGR